MSVVGARPNFMKIAPIIKAINDHNMNLQNNKSFHEDKLIHHVLVHTGQHYDYKMSDAFFSDLNLPKPDIFLGANSGSHAEQTADIMRKFEGVLLQEQPDVMIVVGDVNSTMACTLTASKITYDTKNSRTLIAHVEAGLRSFDRSMPEEINRLVTDALSDFLFTPSEDADENLLREGILPEKIIRVGNVMIDTLASNLGKLQANLQCEKYGLREKQYAFVTLHRPGNVDDESKLSHIVDCLIRVSNKLDIIFPVHPRTKKQMELFHIWEKAKGIPRLVLTEPLGYLDTIGLVNSARFVLTDSGGLQEETTFLKIPCLTLRPNTERPITISKGTNKLTSVQTLEQDISHVLSGFSPPDVVPELWDGLTGERIIQALVKIKISSKTP
ncbi:MAG: UDP-N-acetylglucosamine 2-epimerase [Candidatus Schekmanbacteria bacterium RBG_16_38_10]|uniref:UDP-N-acetylglucosamine 2-epimerase n=1 Tax=Candidatus Schekmanbacteria bacterium RBG_16_38_10 TaxID=1817879 RepID=A0A1F7RRC0_9BACT|nr:MAG: UDP-N-acetylglucosamine 2-epimerase [Candidatus Schekmanbacteria bacterium RBG_16_38_10]